MTQPTEAEPVYFDTVRGHIRVGDLTFADLGNATLSVWSHEGCTITPDTARHLADALNAWVARWERRVQVQAEDRSSEATPTLFEVSA